MTVVRRHAAADGAARLADLLAELLMAVIALFMMV